MGPLQAAADNRRRLCTAPTSTACTHRISAADRVDAQFAERGIEEAVIGAGRNSPSVTNLKPSRSCMRIASTIELSSTAVSVAIYFAFGKADTFVHQFRGTQQAADMFGAERRLRCDCIRSGLRTEIH